MQQTPDNCLSAEEVRSRLYDIASEAHVAGEAIGDKYDDDETIVAVQRVLRRIDKQLLAIAGRRTFDQLRRLEELRRG